MTSVTLSHSNRASRLTFDALTEGDIFSFVDEPETLGIKTDVAGQYVCLNSGGSFSQGTIFDAKATGEYSDDVLLYWTANIAVTP